MPELLIYIPTYNRSTILKTQLLALVPQIKGNPKVALLVSDNASPDNTSIQARDQISSLANAIVRTLPSNVGGNGNAVLGFASEIESKYIWVLADDTIVQPGAVDLILENLKHEPDLVSIRTSSEVSKQTSYEIEREGIGTVFKNSSWGLFSALIYSRKLVSNSLEAGFTFHNSSFPHLAILFDACWKSGSVSVRQLPGTSIFSKYEIDNLDSSIYTLSLAGRPMLLNFASSFERVKLARTWALSNSLGIAAFQGLHPVAASASKAALYKAGGIPARIYLAIGRILWLLQSSSFGKMLVGRISRSDRLSKLVSARIPIQFFDTRTREEKLRSK